MASHSVRQQRGPLDANRPRSSHRGAGTTCGDGRRTPDSVQAAADAKGRGARDLIAVQIARWTGAGPRQAGNSEKCMLTQPWRQPRAPVRHAMRRRRRPDNNPSQVAQLCTKVRIPGALLSRTNLGNIRKALNGRMSVVAAARPPRDGRGE